MNELTVLPALLTVPFFNRFTNWNLLFCFLNIPKQCLLLNSATTWVSFHIGATDGSKIRFMRKYNIRYPWIFVLGDLINHFLPMVYWAVSTKGRIKKKHIYRQLVWICIYYATKSNKLNCERHYCKYPYKRQLVTTMLFPFLFRYAWNAYIKGRNMPLASLAFAVYYVKDFLDIHDNNI